MTHAGRNITNMLLAVALGAIGLLSPAHHIHLLAVRAGDAALEAALAGGSAKAHRPAYRPSYGLSVRFWPITNTAQEHSLYFSRKSISPEGARPEHLYFLRLAAGLGKAVSGLRRFRCGGAPAPGRP